LTFARFSDDALTLGMQDTLEPKLTAAWWLSCNVSWPSDDKLITLGCALVNETRAPTSIHESYVLLARLAWTSPLAYVSCTCVDTDWLASRLFPSTFGTLHDTELAESTTESTTATSWNAVVVPKVPVILALPADLASKRVLLDDAR
jgi:hypothetical protein